MYLRNLSYLDLNKNDLKIYFALFFRVLNMMSVIFFGSYYFGTFWLIVNQELKGIEYGFLDKFSEKLERKTPAQLLTIYVYFAFTTLSTVGFGDYYPVSNTERILGALMLFFGVMTFSYFMGLLMDHVSIVKTILWDQEDSQALNEFFGVLRRFNHDKLLNL